MAKKTFNQYKKDIYDAEHPARIKAGDILDEIQSYLCKKCIKNTDGESWYNLEDFITLKILEK